MQRTQIKIDFFDYRKLLDIGKKRIYASWSEKSSGVILDVNAEKSPTSGYF